jgi:hypothetical protein
LAEKYLCDEADVSKSSWYLLSIIKNAYTVLVGKPEGNRLLDKLRRTWEDNIKTYIK